MVRVRRRDRIAQETNQELRRLAAELDDAERRAAEADGHARAAASADSERARLSRELNEVGAERRDLHARAQALESDAMDAARERTRLQREVRKRLLGRAAQIGVMRASINAYGNPVQMCSR